MRMTFLGATQTVTGSKSLLQVGSARVLVTAAYSREIHGEFKAADSLSARISTGLGWNSSVPYYAQAVDLS